MIKNQVTNTFINDEKANYSIFQTNKHELGKMFDNMVDWFKAPNRTLHGFLVTEGAMHPNGTVRMDRIATALIDKQEQTVKMVFKYFVYNYLYSEVQKIKQQKNDATAKTNLPVSD